MEVQEPGRRQPLLGPPGRVLGPLLGLAVSAGLGAPAHAASETLYEIRQPGALGLGLGVASRASGLSAKWYASETSAVQGVLGLRDAGRGRGEALAASADYLFEQPLLLDDPSVALGWYVGPGAYLGTANGTFPDGTEWRELWVGAGATLGLQMLIRPSPVDVVLEFRPDLQILPAVDLNLVGFGGHIRYFFGAGQRSTGEP